MRVPCRQFQVMKRCPLRQPTSSSGGIYRSQSSDRTNIRSARRWVSTPSLFVALAVLLHESMAFQPSYTTRNRPRMPSSTTSTSTGRIPGRSLSRRYVVTDREPDLVEMLLGGEKYELVPLPDRMIDTTIFVGKKVVSLHYPYSRVIS